MNHVYTLKLNYAITRVENIANLAIKPLKPKYGFNFKIQSLLFTS